MADDAVSWWVEDFEGNVAAAQARMRRELTPKQIERMMEKLRKLEEQELRGWPTMRQQVAPSGRRQNGDEEVP